MKRTDIERKERELRRAEKKTMVLSRKTAREARTAGDYINDLSAIFLYDELEVFNTKEDVRVLEVLENMKEDLPAKQWVTVLKKAVKKTGVRERDRAVTELMDLGGIPPESA
ncbi:MAG: hypothetical protein HS115_04075 [Spirochaetales bacterium]|nr:hypothetical protein [Spirochaetales bacterium]